MCETCAMKTEELLVELGRMGSGHFARYQWETKIGSNGVRSVHALRFVIAVLNVVTAVLITKSGSNGLFSQSACLPPVNPTFARTTLLHRYARFHGSGERQFAPYAGEFALTR